MAPKNYNNQEQIHFYPIPKTGSQSIRDEPEVKSIGHYADFTKKYTNLFTVVRNPEERFLSGYYFFKLDKKSKDPDDFLKMWKNGQGWARLFFMSSFMMSQSKFLSFCTQNIQVIKFESYEFKTHINKGSYKYKLNDKSLEILKELYSDDYELLNSFDNNTMFYSD